MLMNKWFSIAREFQISLYRFLVYRFRIFFILISSIPSLIYFIICNNNLVIQMCMCVCFFIFFCFAIYLVKWIHLKHTHTHTKWEGMCLADKFKHKSSVFFLYIIKHIEYIDVVTRILPLYSILSIIDPEKVRERKKKQRKKLENKIWKTKKLISIFFRFLSPSYSSSCWLFF